jgi:hypothetical protein
MRVGIATDHGGLDLKRKLMDELRAAGTIPELQRTPSHDRGPQRFTPLRWLLYWLMVICILAMLFIGVGMVSTVKPKYLTLVSIHKPLGIAILVLALVRLAGACAPARRRCRSTCPSR